MRAAHRLLPTAVGARGPGQGLPNTQVPSGGRRIIDAASEYALGIAPQCVDQRLRSSSTSNLLRLPRWKATNVSTGR